MTPFYFPVQVYYEDTDCTGFVFHGRYINFFERARTEYLRALGFCQQTMLASDHAFVVSNINVDYLKPARFGDALTVVTHVIERKKVSVSFEQFIVHAGQSDDDKQNRICQAQVKVAYIDKNRNKPVILPNFLEDA